MQKQDPMEVIDPVPVALSYRSERLEIRPLTVGAVPGIVRLARPVIDAVLNLQSVPEEGSEELVDLALDLIDQHGEALYSAVALAVGREREWIEGGDLGEFVELCRALVAVNRDFFARRLLPMLKPREQASAASGTGPTASSSSSSEATH